MIDHIYLPVSDLKRSSEFYKKLLEPLGIDMPYKFDQLHGFAINNIPGFWLKNGEVAEDLYVAFAAKDEAAVNKAYEAALANGGKDNGAPGLRPQWDPRYYAANVLDPDGYNVEICYKPWLYE
jgi:catechol 2,3-dioxygenase-like lactoylglutathione lyase family enzyme